MYYHVRISQRSNRATDETKVDLTEEELYQQFIEPYRRGETIVVKGKNIPMPDLERILVSQSAEPARILFEKVKAENEGRTRFFQVRSWEWRAAERAADVTDRYVVGPPGSHKGGQDEGIKTEGNASESDGKVFVVHGHDAALKNDMEVFLTSIGLRPVVLHREADMGLTLIEKIERHSDVRYAIILLTPDDVAFEVSESAKPEEERVIEKRARQNVVFEFGYFVALLGRPYVCCVYKEGVALPSDVSGLIYKKVNQAVEEIGYALIKELKQAGLCPQV